MAEQLIGVGIYSQPEAARLLHMTPSRLRRWVNGYTYWLDRRPADVRRRRPPVLHKGDLPIMRGAVALSFLELMELRVIRLLVDEHGIPLQKVRRVAQDAQRIFQTRYPLASRNIFAENERVFASVSSHKADSDVVELGRGSAEQIHWAKILEPVIREVEYNPVTSFAGRWWPRGFDGWVVLDPAVMFGAPIIRGSRLRTSAIARMARSAGSRDTAAAYQVPEEGVDAAVEFETHLAAA